MSIFGKIVFAPLHILGWIVKIVLGVVILAVLVVGAVNAFVIGTTSSQIVTAKQALTAKADAIVVLGASVYADGTPSTILQDRLDDAIEMYELGVAQQIIVSGDNTEEHYCESVAMKDYLVANGIPESAIICDYAGFSTYDTMYRARYVFGCSSIVIATQEYHLPRAIFDAQGVGMKAVGVAADGSHTYENQSYYDIREVFSRVKDAWEVLNKTTVSLSNEIDTSARSASNMEVLASNVANIASNVVAS